MTIDNDDLQRILSTIERQTDETLRITGKTWVQEASANAIEAVLIKLGIDYKDPLSMQKDFAHVRQDRLTKEDSIKRLRNNVIDKGFTITVSTFCAGVVSWFISKGP